MAAPAASADRRTRHAEIAAAALALGAIALPVGGFLTALGLFSGSDAGVGDYAALAGGAANVVAPLMLVAALALLVSHPGRSETRRRWSQLAVIGGGGFTALLLAAVVLQALTNQIWASEPFPGTSSPATPSAVDQLIARVPLALLYGSGAVLAACASWWATGLGTPHEPGPEADDD